MLRRVLVIGLMVLSWRMTVVGEEMIHYELSYRPAPVDNPLKGLVPYASAGRHECFSHSMEFMYLPLKGLMDQDESGKEGYRYDFGPLEKLLNDVSSRGCQTVFRIYLEYPNKPLAVPDFLIEQGVQVHRWKRDNKGAVCLTPDYEDLRLRKALAAFISELGRRYDGDSRIGYITAGLLGLWGEWHDYPQNELFASKTVQREVMEAYGRAFRVTPILLRYPAGPENDHLAANQDEPFGYHDDSFGWATLDTGRRADYWFFMTAMKAAGPRALDKWKRYPIGGEIRPELWSSEFSDRPHPKAQDFLTCVHQSHVTWLMDSGLFNPSQPLGEARRQRAMQEVGEMGYAYHIREATAVWESEGLAVTVQVENRGVAPFYYNWPVELAVLDGQMEIAEHWFPDWKLRGILPGEPVRWEASHLKMEGVVRGKAKLGLRVANPMRHGMPLRFANREQQNNGSGWLILGELPVKD